MPWFSTAKVQRIFHTHKYFVIKNVKRQKKTFWGCASQPGAKSKRSLQTDHIYSICHQTQVKDPDKSWLVQEMPGTAGSGWLRHIRLLTSGIRFRRCWTHGWIDPDHQDTRLAQAHQGSVRCIPAHIRPHFVCDALSVCMCVIIQPDVRYALTDKSRYV